MIRLAQQWWSDLQGRSGARIVIGVAIGLLGMVLGVVLQANQLFKQPAGDDPRLLIASAKRTDRPGQAQVGHLVYTITSARLQRVRDPKDHDEVQCLALISVRVADVQGISDYIDNQTFRLLVDGEALSHVNNVNLPVYEKSATHTDLTFILPEETATAELLVGRPNEGVARIPVDLAPRRMADGS
jgi:hypothetical protein